MLSWMTTFATTPWWNWLLNWLVAYYKSDTNWSFPDAHSTNDGTINGATYTTSGKINWAYSYTTNDWIDIPINSQSQFTKAAWVYITADTSGAIMSKYDGSLKIDQLYYNDVSNNIIQDFGQVWWSRNQVGTAAISLNTWYYVVTTWDWTTAKIYLNAWTPVTSTTTPDDFVDTTNFDLWARQWTWFLSGRIDEIWYWNRALSADDVTLLYNSWSGFSYDNFTN